MKEFRILFFVATFLMVVLAIQIEIAWLLYVVAGFYLMEGIVERIHEEKKRAKAIFFLKDLHKTILNYAIVLGMLAINFVFLLKQDAVSVSVTFYITSLLWIIISRGGEAYFLFDQEGIKTARKLLNYSQIQELQLTDKGLTIETNDRSEGIEIGKKLLNADVLSFLESKIKVIHSA
ncbi:hypothetical protein GXP67_14120 [Rhodocytophaga rosea]|uniref:Uncharacterized protein n=1 Tax=Rhodocytophaga rosea TaxID=2704465 RepID=A0A6C0GIE7_9BACT|nr:hypothetical protein [Rhodocytophaga rosea]QHT67685.1 hypothetical protein GXP67_14120 [Rhodocytophaga rosea]